MRLIELQLEEIERQSFCIGFEGEQNHTGIVFQCDAVFAEYPSAAATMAVKSPSGDLYPVSLDREGEDLVWIISASDCVSSGLGQYQLTFVDGQAVIKTFIGSFLVMPSLMATGNPPAPLTDWLQRAGLTLGAFENMTARAETLAYDQLATAVLTDAEGHKALCFGIPAGQPGPQGERGPQGETGPQGEPGPAADVDETLSVEGAAADAKAVGDLKADRRDTVLDTSLSRGRKAETTVGVNSFAFGYDVTASGDYAHAEGAGTTASGAYAHAEGTGTTASGAYAHTEGGGTLATASYAHAEGGGCQANGYSAHAEGSGTRANANYSHAEGGGTTASGEDSHAEGGGTTASGVNAHAEGGGTKATNTQAHAEGGGCQATGTSSHAEGSGTTASGSYAHSEGSGTTASGQSSHAEGSGTQATYNNTHAEGSSTRATGFAAHAEGARTTSSESTTWNGNTYYYGATGYCAHSEGENNVAAGTDSHAEGYSTKAIGLDSHTEGAQTVATGSYGHAEGFSTQATGSYSHAEGDLGIASGAYSHAEGLGGSYTQNGITTTCNARGTADHVEGYQCETTANGQPGNHAEGYQTHATGGAAHAENAYTTAAGNSSHAEGNNTKAAGSYAHAEGFGGSYTTNGVTTQCVARGTADHTEGYQCETGSGQPGNHAEGYQTHATGGAAHAENGNTVASGYRSHAEGYGTTASGGDSHAEGWCTVAAGSRSHVSGQYNLPDNYDSWPEWTADTPYVPGDRVKRMIGVLAYGYICKNANQDASFTSSNWEEQSGKMNYAEIVGNGKSAEELSNARTLDWEGNGWYAGGLTAAGGTLTLGSVMITEAQLQALLALLPASA